MQGQSQTCTFATIKILSGESSGFIDTDYEVPWIKVGESDGNKQFVFIEHKTCLFLHKIRSFTLDLETQKSMYLKYNAY